jgi:hypothetical protein
MSRSAAASSIFRSGIGATGIFKLCRAFLISQPTIQTLDGLVFRGSDSQLGLPGAGWLP